MLVVPLIMTLGATMQAAVKPDAPTANTAPRTWHVAPEELKGISPANQLRTIAEVAAKAEPGDLVVIHSGVYREAVTVEASGTKEKPIRFEAAPGENVVITGADAIRNWKKEPGSGRIFSDSWPHRFIGWPQSGHLIPEERTSDQTRGALVRLGYSVASSQDRDQLGRGTFFVDPARAPDLVCPRDGADLARDDHLLDEISYGLLPHDKSSKGTRGTGQQMAAFTALKPWSAVHGSIAGKRVRG